MNIGQQMQMFWNEKADKLLIPFLDKHDQIKLSMSKSSQIFEFIV